MKIAVIGVYYAFNLGDAVICDCVADWLCEQYPQAEVDVIDITGKTEFGEQQPVSMLTLKRRQWHLEKDYRLTRSGKDDRLYYWSHLGTEGKQAFYDEVVSKNYDAAVFAGGQMFMDWLSLDICEFLKRFEKTGTPVFFNACGVGLSISQKIREELNIHLNRGDIRMISSRDDTEKINDRYMRGTQRAVSTYDPALWASEVYQIEKKESFVVGLGVMYCENISLRKLTAFWVRLIKELNRRGISWKMFCNGALDDYNFGCHVLKKLGLNPKEWILDHPKTPKELIEQISGFSGVISFRLHSHIIAASLNIPAIALVWDDKLRFFYRHLGHEERCMTVEAGPKEVLAAFERACKEGLDAEVLTEQKTYAKNLLLNAVKQVMSNE